MSLRVERNETKHKPEAGTLRERKSFVNFTFCYIVRFICADLLAPNSSPRLASILPSITSEVIIPAF
jgi:hypothetical protein